MTKKSKISNQIRVRIPHPEVWEDFQEFVEEKYGSSYAVTGLELEKALKYHLAMEGWKEYPDMMEEGIIVEKPRAHTHKICSTDRILIQTIYKEMKVGGEVPFTKLRKWIAAECGLRDKRTHKDHVDSLVALGVLKSLDEPYVLYKVLDPVELN
jgi:hypothetical protein